MNSPIWPPMSPARKQRVCIDGCGLQGVTSSQWNTNLWLKKVFLRILNAFSFRMLSRGYTCTLNIQIIKNESRYYVIDYVIKYSQTHLTIQPHHRLSFVQWFHSSGLQRKYPKQESCLCNLKNIKYIDDHYP